MRDGFILAAIVVLACIIGSILIIAVAAAHRMFA